MLSASTYTTYNKILEAPPEQGRPMIKVNLHTFLKDLVYAQDHEEEKELVPESIKKRLSKEQINDIDELSKRRIDFREIAKIAKSMNCEQKDKSPNAFTAGYLNIFIPDLMKEIKNIRKHMMEPEEKISKSTFCISYNKMLGERTTYGKIF